MITPVSGFIEPGANESLRGAHELLIELVSMKGILTLIIQHLTHNLSSFTYIDLLLLNEVNGIVREMMVDRW